MNVNPTGPFQPPPSHDCDRGARLPDGSRGCWKCHVEHRLATRKLTGYAYETAQVYPGRGGRRRTGR